MNSVCDGDKDAFFVMIYKGCKTPWITNSMQDTFAFGTKLFYFWQLII